MTREVTAPMVRSFRPDMFDDLGVTVADWSLESGVASLTFDADLDDATVQAIRDRMTSRDDEDQAERAVQRERAEKAEAWVDKNATAEAQIVWLTQAFADLARYVLGPTT